MLGGRLTRSSIRAHIAQRYDTLGERGALLVDHTERRDLGLRSIAGRPNGTLDPYYQCSLLGELWDYAANYTYPWSASGPFF
jgi:carboxypeptidase D